MKPQQEQKEIIRRMVALSKRANKDLPKGEKTFGILGDVSAEEVLVLGAVTGLKLSGYKRIVDKNYVRKILKSHGGSTEGLRRQIPVTEADFELIPQIIQQGKAFLSPQKSKSYQLPVIIYEAVIGDICFFYAEEVRGPDRKSLSLLSLYKKPAGKTPNR